ncbi:Hypothetical predicted protein, partial [Olea europaea subsp. europaea]
RVAIQSPQTLGVMAPAWESYTEPVIIIGAQRQESWPVLGSQEEQPAIKEALSWLHLPFGLECQNSSFKCDPIGFQCVLLEMFR